MLLVHFVSVLLNVTVVIGPIMFRCHLGMCCTAMCAVALYVTSSIFGVPYSHVFVTHTTMFLYHVYVIVC